MTAQQFDAIVEKAIAKIPARFRKRLENVAFVVEPEPPRPGILGLYQGRPLTVRSFGDAFAMPDRITIFQGPHERSARTYEELQALVDETVWHEVAHYFGMDEARVRRAEQRRRMKIRGRTGEKQ